MAVETCPVIKYINRGNALLYSVAIGLAVLSPVRWQRNVESNPYSLKELHVELSSVILPPFRPGPDHFLMDTREVMR